MASYAVVEKALAKMHGADPEAQRGAFRGRLKHLQRLGLPLGKKPGKGKRIDYTDEQISQLALALELSELGIDPTVIVNIITSYWEEIIIKMLRTEVGRDQTWAVLALTVRLMSASWNPGGGIANGVHTLNWITANNEIKALLSPSSPRTVIIDIHSVMKSLSDAVLEAEREAQNGDH